MSGVHFYEVVSEVYFRRHNGPIVPCKVVRTQAFASRVSGSSVFHVGISMLVSGFENHEFSRWFSDWSPADDNTRQIETLVPVKQFNQTLEAGRSIADKIVIAVRIDDVWVMTARSPYHMT